MSSPAPRRTANTDAWEAMVGEEKRKERIREANGVATPEVKPTKSQPGLASQIFVRPISLVVNCVGLLYAAACLYWLAHGDFLETYGFSDIAEKNVAVVPPTTLIISSSGIALMLGWLIVPPLWFSVESRLLATNDQERKLVRESQDISIKAWLAVLVLMGILGK